MSAPFPVRPRLAEHALARRHDVDGRAIVVIHDARTGDLHRLDLHQWALVACADGTRDLDGIALAASRAGVYRRSSEIDEVLGALHAAGLLADGVDHPLPIEPLDPELPLDVLPGFSLHCDGSGTCCSLYATVLFSPDDVARARAAAPAVPAERHLPFFLPGRGLGDDALAVGMVDGRCAYLEGDGRCAVHAAAGAAAKPRGCRVYPATFVADGASVRVSVGVECPCVLASVGRRGGAPLVDPAARRAGDLEPPIRLLRLPASIAVSSARTAPREELVAWSRALVDAIASPPPPDGVAALWSLAAAVEAHGLEPEASARAARGPQARPSSVALAPWLEALARRARARVASADAWRSERDRSRRASHWLADAAVALAETAAAETRSAGRLEALPEPAAPASEAFYLRASIHGHHLAGDAPLAHALRDRAVRLLLARALPPAMAASGAGADPGHAHPIAVMEAMMRGHGLAAYAGEVELAKR